MNITEQVLAAFQVEYREHLEGIRTLLARREFGADGWSRECIDQAFRLAHSLKGGARVCDLRPIEELGHRLEAVFEQVRSGALQPDEEVAATVMSVLDAVEDWMTIRERDADPAAPRAALEAIERLLHRGAATAEAVPAAAPVESVPRRLLAAFRSEYPNYLAGLHQLASPTDDDGAHPADWEEGYRLAHNLCASAEAAELRALADVCGDLETLIGEFCERDAAPDSESRERLQACLAAIGRELRSSDSLTTTPPVSQRGAGDGSETGAAESGGREAAAPKPLDAGPLPAARTADTVRIGTAGLDALLLSSRQLLTVCLSQDQIGRELDEVRRQIDDLQREHESFRRAVTANSSRPDVLPEGNRIFRYFDYVDRDIRTLARRSRHVCELHKRTARNLQASARRIEQDVGLTRMVPAETIYQCFRKMVRDLAREAGKQVEFRVTGFDVRADRMVFQALKDPLIHMLRNCVVHGIETPERRREVGKDPLGRVDLRIETTGNRLTVEVDDDGRGLDRERIYRRAVESGLLSLHDRNEPSAAELDHLIYQPGFTTSEQLTEVAGRGMGLSVVRETVTRLQGEIQLRPKDSAGTRFRITVPLSVSTHRLLLVSLQEQTYAIPIHGIERLLRIPAADCEMIEGRPVVTFCDRPIPLVELGRLLGVARDGDAADDTSLWVVVIKTGSRRIAVSVDAMLAEQDLLIQDLDAYAASRRYWGAVLLEDGRAAPVLNPAELSESFHAGAEQAVVENARPRQAKRTPRVLVVDDSFTTRTLEKSILEADGFQVGIAVDGLEGLNQLRREHYDLVITDVEMPRMDGFALLAAIKQDERLSSTPVVLVTSRDRREDQEKGLDLGANAYIVKQKFDHQSWLSAVREIVGA